MITNKIMLFLIILFSLSYSPDINENLFEAIIEGDSAKVMELIAKGANVNTKNKDEKKYYRNITPLHLAAIAAVVVVKKEEIVEILKILIQKGSDIHAKDIKGRIALHFASINNNLEIIKILIDQGARINAKDIHQQTPLDLARSYEAKKMIRDAGGKSKKLALFKAVDENDYETIDKLLQNGANIDAFDYPDGDTILHRAIIDNNEEMLLFLVKKDANINANSENKRGTPLDWAVTEENIKMVQLLIDNGADVNVKMNCWFYDMTPLHFAAENGFSEIARLLMKHGANKQAKTKEGYTILHAACAGGLKWLVDDLISEGVDIHSKTSRWPEKNLSPLHFALENEHYEIAKTLIKKGANIDSDLISLLNKACSGGQKWMVELLLKKGVNINKTVNGFLFKDISPLFAAAVNGHSDIARFLIHNGANIFAKSSEGFTVLFAACQGNLKWLVQDLIRQGVDVNDYIYVNNNHLRNSPLNIAATLGHYDIVKMLIEAGADVNVTIALANTTPLYWAISNKHSETAKLLISKGADVNIEDERGTSPLLLAVYRNELELVQILIDKKAVINPIKDENCDTPLHAAAFKGELEMVKLLMAHGAKVNALNQDNQTPLNIAVEQEYLEVVEFLEQNGAKLN